MKNKKVISKLILILFTIQFFSCNSNSANSNKNTKSTISISDDDIIAKAWFIGGAYSITFMSDHTYKIVLNQTSSCYGEGKWFIENNKINLGANDSRCETGRNLQGLYSYSQLSPMYPN